MSGSPSFPLANACTANCRCCLRLCLFRSLQDGAFTIFGESESGSRLERVVHRAKAGRVVGRNFVAGAIMSGAALLTPQAGGAYWVIYGQTQRGRTNGEWAAGYRSVRDADAELAKILGHSDIKMTERYAKLARKHFAKPAARCGRSGSLWSNRDATGRISLDDVRVLFARLEPTVSGCR
jgi:hypothetical protein